MMFLKMMLPLACLAVQESPQGRLAPARRPDTSALLKNIIIREFKIRAREAGKEHMLPELMKKLEDEYTMNNFVRDLNQYGTVDVDFDSLEQRRRHVTNIMTEDNPENWKMSEWHSEFEWCSHSNDTGKIAMRNRDGKPSDEFKGDGNLYYLTPVFMAGQSEYRLKQRFGFPFGLRISSTKANARWGGIYATFTSIEEERERTLGPLRCKIISQQVDAAVAKCKRELLHSHNVDITNSNNQRGLRRLRRFVRDNVQRLVNEDDYFTIEVDNIVKGVDFVSTISGRDINITGLADIEQSRSDKKAELEAKFAEALQKCDFATLGRLAKELEILKKEL